MKRALSRLAPLVLLLLALTACNQAPAVRRLIPQNAVDPLALLPLPPTKGSREELADLATVLAFQQDRTEAEIARAKSEHVLTIDAFTATIGPWFTAQNLPVTAAFMAKLLRETRAFSDIDKNFYKRPRPFMADARVHPLVIDREPSYPSGHATRGILMAVVLAEAFPELKDKLYTRGQEIGWDRIIAGVHYPSDVYNGRVLGQNLAHAALANPGFKTAFEKVRAEIESARKAATK